MGAGASRQSNAGRNGQPLVTVPSAPASLASLPDPVTHAVASGNDAGQNRVVSNLTAELMQCKAKLALVEHQLSACTKLGVPQTECIVCMDAPVDTVLLPCGHLCMCNECSSSLLQSAKVKASALRCPVCRATASTVKRIFLPVQKPRAVASKQKISEHLHAANSAALPGTSQSIDRPPLICARDGAVSLASFPSAHAESASALFSKTSPASFAFLQAHLDLATVR